MRGSVPCVLCLAWGLPLALAENSLKGPHKSPGQCEGGHPRELRTGQGLPVSPAVKQRLAGRVPRKGSCDCVSAGRTSRRMCSVHLRLQPWGQEAVWGQQLDSTSADLSYGTGTWLNS